MSVPFIESRHQSQHQSTSTGKTTLFRYEPFLQEERDRDGSACYCGGIEKRCPRRPKSEGGGLAKASYRDAPYRVVFVRRLACVSVITSLFLYRTVLLTYHGKDARFEKDAQVSR